MLLLSLLGWPLRRTEPERAAVAGTYRAVAEAIEAAATDAYDTRRQAVTQSLNTAYDLILARRAREHGRRGELVRLLAQLNVVIPIVEAAPAVHLRGWGVDPAIPAAVRQLADAVEEGRTGAVEPDLPAPATPAERALDTALRHAFAVVHAPRPRPLQHRRPARPPRRPAHPRRAARPATSCSPAPPGATDYGSPCASGSPRRWSRWCRWSARTGSP